MATKKLKRSKNKEIKAVDFNEKDASSTLSSGLKRKKYLIFLGLLVLAAALYFGRSFFIAALVGGRPISRFELTKQLEKQAGQSTLDALINKELILQEAKKNNVEVKDEDVQKEIDELKKTVEAQGNTLEAALAAQGQTVDDLNEAIYIKQVVEKLLSDKVQVSEDDAKAYFEENKEFYGEGAKYEDQKDGINEQLRQEKLSAAFQEWITKLKTDSKVIYFVNF